MYDLNSLIVNGEPLTNDERRRLAASMEEDERLAATVGSWRTVLDSVRQGMTNLPSSETLILYALSDELLPGETTGPESLLTADEQHELNEVLLDVRSAAESHPSIGTVLRRMREDREAFEALWEERSQRRGFSGVFAPDRVPKRADRKPVRRWGYRVAVTVAVTAFALIAGSLFFRDFQSETIRASEIQTVALSDGSQVELAEGAELRLPRGFLNRDARRATLVSGEALFDIAHNPERPFRVETRNAEITVLGTTFGVSATDISTEVTLVSGSVNVGLKKDRETAVTLQPGEQSRVVAADAPSEPEPVDVSVGLTWTGDIYAQDMALSEVTRGVEERFDVAISVDDELAEERITGVFRNEHGVEDALQKLALALDARFERIEGGYQIVR